MAGARPSISPSACRPPCWCCSDPGHRHELDWNVPRPYLDDTTVPIAARVLGKGAILKSGSSIASSKGWRLHHRPNPPGVHPKPLLRAVLGHTQYGAYTEDAAATNGARTVLLKKWAPRKSGAARGNRTPLGPRR